MPSLRQTTTLDCKPEQLFQAPEPPRGFLALHPDRPTLVCLAPHTRMAVGQVVRCEMHFGLFRTVWSARIVRCELPVHAEYALAAGPFGSWVHRQRFQPVGTGTLVEDHIEYQAAAESLHPLLDSLWIAHQWVSPPDTRKNKTTEKFQAIRRKSA